MINWGSYQRNVIFILNNNLMAKTIRIRRVKCKHCNKTHALLLNQIIPYKQVVLDVILNCIFDTELSNKFDISFDTIFNWKKKFNYFKSFFFTTFNFLSTDYILKFIYYVYDHFYFVNNKILMMTHHGIYNMAYF